MNKLQSGLAGLVLATSSLLSSYEARAVDVGEGIDIEITPEEFPPMIWSDDERLVRSDYEPLALPPYQEDIPNIANYGLILLGILSGAYLLADYIPTSGSKRKSYKVFETKKNPYRSPESY